METRMSEQKIGEHTLAEWTKIIMDHSYRHTGLICFAWALGKVIARRGDRLDVGTIKRLMELIGPEPPFEREELCGIPVIADPNVPPGKMFIIPRQPDVEEFSKEFEEHIKQLAEKSMMVDLGEVFKDGKPDPVEPLEDP
jgi:hypothetical protein